MCNIVFIPQRILKDTSGPKALNTTLILRFAVLQVKQEMHLVKVSPLPRIKGRREIKAFQINLLFAAPPVGQRVRGNGSSSLLSLFALRSNSQFSFNHCFTSNYIRSFKVQNLNGCCFLTFLQVLTSHGYPLMTVLFSIRYSNI